MENLTKQVKALQKDHDVLKEVVQNLIEAFVNLKNNKRNDNYTEENN